MPGLCPIAAPVSKLGLPSTLRLAERKWRLSQPGLETRDAADSGVCPTRLQLLAGEDRGTVQVTPMLESPARDLTRLVVAISSGNRRG